MSEDLLCGARYHVVLPTKGLWRLSALCQFMLIRRFRRDNVRFRHLNND